MGNSERSKDPPADVAIDGWFDLLDDEADASAPRPTQRPTKSPQGPNLSALNEISNKVTPVMLSPVHHLLPAIEPTHLSNEPRDVWETDVGNELDSFFAVPPANAEPRVERKRDEEFESKKQEAEGLIHEIERLFDKVAKVVGGSDYGRDALEKAHGVIERTRIALDRRDTAAIKEQVDALSRTLRMFKGVVQKG